MRWKKKNKSFGATWVWTRERDPSNTVREKTVAYVQAYDEMCVEGDESESYCKSLKDLKTSGYVYYGLDVIGIFCSGCAFLFTLFLIFGHYSFKHVFAYQIIIVFFLFTSLVCFISSVGVFMQNYIPHLVNFMLFDWLHFIIIIIIIIIFIIISKQVSDELFLYYYSLESTMTWEKAEGGISVYLTVLAIICNGLALLLLSCCEVYRKDDMDINDLTPWKQVQADYRACIACLNCRRNRNDANTHNNNNNEYEKPGDGSDDEKS
ncbi:hypothetical protein RFI_17620 [Reticulomyxa filosa]|uniref:Uncharacterized protein n=1 Tax=Reticulomyxa filosa TaxID=46433 RepID=X6N121_RETFI|nr:hypothetical protein RFI_17620 [Reticulomyxa filosa]|eukprot:ETO19613.1 hypothetical protein RFI_17620 [Reticulomyxa filosa]